MGEFNVERAKDLGREPTALELAHDFRQLNYEIADIEREVRSLADKIAVLTYAAYKLADYEQKAGGEFGPRD